MITFNFVKIVRWSLWGDGKYNITKDAESRKGVPFGDYSN